MKNCPICDSEIKKSTSTSTTNFSYRETFYCKNACYIEFWENGVKKAIQIFNDKFFVNSIDSEIQYELMNKKIDYWKENYRYLAHILAESPKLPPLFIIPSEYMYRMDTKYGIDILKSKNTAIITTV